MKAVFIVSLMVQLIVTDQKLSISSHSVTIESNQHEIPSNLHSVHLAYTPEVFRCSC